MLGILLGLGASLCWGVSDFLGGLESRHNPQVGVMLVGASVGFVLLAVGVAVTGAAVPPAKYLLVGAAGGMSVTIALWAFYRGLATGVMSVVAPIAATGVVVPVVVGVAGGEKPSVLRLVGAAMAIVGVVLVSRQRSDGTRRNVRLGLSVVLALVAALGFGGEFVFLRAAAKGDPEWGALAAVSTYFALIGIAALVTVRRHSSLKPSVSSWPRLLAFGICFGAANAFYANATRHGQLSAIAVAASLYPAVTVLLARSVLQEYIRRIQEVGIVAAIAGIILIAAG